jgi:hypothetical protein
MTATAMTPETRAMMPSTIGTTAEIDRVALVLRQLAEAAR